MPDEVKPVAPQTPEQLAAHNAEVARKVAGQDILAQPTKTEEFGEASGALDALAAQVKPKEAVPETKPETKQEAAEPRPAAPKAPEAPPPEPEPPPHSAAGKGGFQKRADDLFRD